MGPSEEINKITNGMSKKGGEQEKAKRGKPITISAQASPPAASPPRAASPIALGWYRHCVEHHPRQGRSVMGPEKTAAQPATLLAGKMTRENFVPAWRMDTT